MTAPLLRVSQGMDWQVATVVDLARESPRSRRIVLQMPTWSGNVGGQHVDVRLTAPDGYQASRSYSLASVGDTSRIELVVDRLEGGEVSPFLNDVLEVGDRIEVRGPLGAWFVWTPPTPDMESRPVQLIAGGSGVVPMLSILRSRLAAADTTPMRLLYSVRSPEEVFLPQLLEAAAHASNPVRVDLVYTRTAPLDGPPAGRISRARFDEATLPAADAPRVYVCGATNFVEAIIGWLNDAGHVRENIRAERYGG